MHICATAPGASVDEIAAGLRRAAGVGVAFHPLSLFALSQAPSAGLVLGYGAIATDRIETGLDRLHGALARVR